MARLPTPGQDQGQWGQILNDYLSVSHASDGSLKDTSIIGAKLANDTIPAGKLTPTTQTSLTKADSSVQSVNAKFPSSGNVVLTAGDVSAIPASEKGAMSGVADLDSQGKLPESRLPSTAVTSEQLGYDSLAPLIYRMKAGDALRLAVSSSSSLMNPTIPVEGQTGQKMWAAVLAKYGNTVSIIEGRGASGASIEHLLNGGVSPEMMPAEAVAMIGSGFDAVLINMNYDNDNAKGTTMQQFYQRYVAVIRAVQRTGAIPIIIPPLKAGVYFSGSPANYEIACYRAAADAGAVLFPIQDSLLLTDGSGIEPAYYQPDLVHPNAAGADKYATDFAALWPSNPPTSGAVGRRPRGTFDDPQIVGRFFHWTDSFGVDRRTTWSLRFTHDDGRLASTPVLSDPGTWIRNPAFTSDLRNPGSGELIADLAKTVGESDAYLGSALGDGVNDAAFLSGGGVNFGGNSMFSIPVASKRDLQFGRDNITLRLVVSNVTSNGQDQTLWSRRNLTGGINHIRIYLENATGDLVVQLANSETRIASPGILGTGKAHVVTITATAAIPNGVAARCYIDGVSRATCTVGTAFGVGYALLPWRVGATVTGGGSFAFWLNGRAHWCEVGACFTDRAEESAWITNQLKPALAARSLTWV
jgi:hypothetical protein